MRIDKINILGPFVIKGLTGSNGQVFGLSGSEVTWITPTGNGSQGPIGPTGGGFASIPNSQIVFGCSSAEGGMTSSSYFQFDCLKIKHGNSIIDNAYGQGVILGSRNAKIYSNFNNSVILGGLNNISHSSVNSSIIGGNLNTICNSSFSSIIGGKNSTMKNGCFNSIIGGNCNKMPPDYYGGLNFQSTILGGKSNHISRSYCSTILSGQSNCVAYSCLSSIIGGRNNKIYNLYQNSWNSVIIGGYGNRLSARNSVTLASKKFGGGDTLLKNNSVVIGSSNLSISSYCENYTFMSNLYIYNTLCMISTVSKNYNCTLLFGNICENCGLFFVYGKTYRILTE